MSAADAVRAAFPMSLAVPVLREAMRSFARGAVEQPLRVHLTLPTDDGTMLVKPAAISGQDAAIGLKVVSVVPGNAARGLPVINGFVALLDPTTGSLEALMDGAAVTEIRTGAASAVATDLLARPDAGDLALLGAGVQARAHLAAIAEVRTLRRVRVWSRTRARAEDLARWAAAHGWTVEVADGVRSAVRGADIVCTLTASPVPILESDWLAPSCHVNAVGAFTAQTRELATDVILAADVIVVDSLEAARAESGDLLIPEQEGVLPLGAAYPELGQLLDDPQRVGLPSGGRTIHVSLGLALQDVASARAIVAAARSRRLGVDVAWEQREPGT